MLKGMVALVNCVSYEQSISVLSPHVLQIYDIVMSRALTRMKGPSLLYDLQYVYF